MSALKRERVEFRLSESEKNTLEEAAILSNTTVSKFVSDLAVIKAQEVINEHKRLKIEAAQWDSIMESLENPTDPNELMKEIISTSLEESWTVKINK